MAQLMHDPLVSTDWLQSQLNAPDLVIFDCTFFLPADQRDARAEYAEAHIPGARFFDVDQIADPDDTLPHMVPSPARFARLMGEKGVSNQSRVVFYDAKGLFSAARGWWLMGLFGHDAAFVLDGGLPKWRKEERPTEGGAELAAKPAHFVPTLRAGRLRGAGDLAANIETKAELVLDARAAARFRAEQPEPRAGIRAGHIPGSRNLPFGELLTAEGTMKPAEALRARFAEAGVDGSKPVVTSCGSGISGAMLTLGLCRAGFPQGALYDGSWTEWGGRHDLPLEV
jgi:thiosulfate/3-mercaptopyruvate sulfurtransferase